MTVICLHSSLQLKQQNYRSQISTILLFNDSVCISLMGVSIVDASVNGYNSRTCCRLLYNNNNWYGMRNLWGANLFSPDKTIQCSILCRLHTPWYQVFTIATLKVAIILEVNVRVLRWHINLCAVFNTWLCAAVVSLIPNKCGSHASSLLLS